MRHSYALVEPINCTHRHKMNQFYDIELQDRRNDSTGIEQLPTKYIDAVVRSIDGIKIHRNDTTCFNVST